MKIISFLNTKGGVGKSTLCVNLAACLAKFPKGHPHNHYAKVLIVDADPQGSVRDWNEAAEQHRTVEINVIAADRKEMLHKIPQAFGRGDYDYAIIDTPGKASEIVGTAISISDLCIIPVQPSPYDIWATNDVIELLKLRWSVSEGRPYARLLLNRCIPNTRLGKEVMEHLQHVPVPSFEFTIGQRTAYAETAVKGGTVFESCNAQAIAEMIALAETVKELLSVA